MDHFSFDYVVQSDSTPTEEILCMRCGDVVERSTGRQVKVNGKDVIVPFLKPSSHHVQVPVLVSFDGRIRMVHLQMCSACKDFELTDDLKPKIVKQCKDACVAGLRWSHYPDEKIKMEEAHWDQAIVLRRLYGKELEDAYNGKTEVRR